MKYGIAFAAAWFLAALNVSAMPYIKVLGVTPDFVLIFAAAWAVVRGRDEALWVVPLAGFLRDLTTSDPVGTSVLALAPMVLLATALRVQSIDSEFLPTVAVVAGGSLCYSIISMTVLAGTGHDISLPASLLRITLPLMIVNPLFSPIVYLPVHWLTPRVTGFRGAARLTSPLI